MSDHSIQFFYKSTCNTCRRARSRLREAGIVMEERDMSKNPLTAEELDALIGERDVRDFLNPRNELYRSRGYKAHPPERDEAIREMAAEPNLIRRPLLKRGDDLHFGADADAIPWLELAPHPAA